MKKHLISFSLIVGLIAALLPQMAMAYTLPDMVSVGLESVCRGAASATLTGDTLYVGTEERGIFRQNATLDSSSNFSVRVAGGSFVAADAKMTYKEASLIAGDLIKLGYLAYPAYLNGDIWTVFSTNMSISQMSSAGGYNGYQVHNFVGVLVSGSEGSVVLSQSGDIVIMGAGRDDTFTINTKVYRGMLSFVISGGAMTAVNRVGLEEYLYGVVAAEMPQSYKLEALKAQAVSARTYALTKLGAHENSGYQLCDTTACQVYGGYSWETESTTRAIDATKGEIICYNGNPIEAVFSASTGGYTENSENVWSAAVPYLRAVPEIGEYGDNTWTLTTTTSELTALAQSKGDNLGTVKDIVITKLSTGGRVQEMRIVGTNGGKTLTGEGIRTYFSGASCGSLPGKMFTINGRGGEIGIYGASYSEKTARNVSSNSLLASVASGGIKVLSEGSLSSLNGRSLEVDMGDVDLGTTPTPVVQNQNYEVYSVNISTVDNSGRFVFNGIGRGHGVGLSQKGAQAMAEMGYTYDQILKYYYTGVTIEEGR